MACRTARAKRDLVRVVRTPDGSLVLDKTGRRAGRGAYLCPDGGCWQQALAKGALTRALGVPIPDGIRARLEAGPATTHGGNGRPPNESNQTNDTNETTTGGLKRGEE